MIKTPKESILKCVAHLTLDGLVTEIKRQGPTIS